MCEIFLKWGGGVICFLGGEVGCVVYGICGIRFWFGCNNFFLVFCRVEYFNCVYELLFILFIVFLDVRNFVIFGF